jgi:hypothetical protein
MGNNAANIVPILPIHSQTREHTTCVREWFAVGVLHALRGVVVLSGAGLADGAAEQWCGGTTPRPSSSSLLCGRHYQMDGHEAQELSLVAPRIEGMLNK